MSLAPPDSSSSRSIQKRGNSRSAIDEGPPGDSQQTSGHTLAIPARFPSPQLNDGLFWGIYRRIRQAKAPSAMNHKMWIIIGITLALEATLSQGAMHVTRSPTHKASPEACAVCHPSAPLVGGKCHETSASILDQPTNKFRLMAPVWKSLLARSRAN